MINDIILEFIICFTVLTITLLVNKLFPNRFFTIFYNSLVFSESFILTFFFNKFSFIISFPTLVISSYFLFLNNKHFPSNSDKKFIFFYNQKFFRRISVVLILVMILYEYYSSFTISSNNLLVLILSLSFYFYDFVPNNYSQERDVFFLFLIFVSFFTLFPLLLNKFLLAKVGFLLSTDNEYLVEIFLGTPLYKILDLLGFNVALESDTIFFEDNQSGLFTGVKIAKSCSGIVSIQIFTSLILSYVVSIYKKFDFLSVVIVFLAIAIAFVSNLVRMVIIVIVGHYQGVDAMLWVHEYLGWFLFTIIVFFSTTFFKKVSKYGSY